MEEGASGDVGHEGETCGRTASGIRKVFARRGFEKALSAKSVVVGARFDGGVE